MTQDSTKNTDRKDFGKRTFLHIDQLYTYALLMTGEDRKAEKLLLKTYEQAYGFWKYLSGETIIELWLFRILTKLYRESNLIVQDTKQEYSDAQIFNLTDDDKKILEQKPSFPFTSKIIKNISSLPLEMKEVFVLTNAHNFSYETATELIDIPEGTIKKRLFDAKKFFLSKLLYDKSEVKRNNSSLSSETKKIIISLTDQDKNSIHDEQINSDLQPEIELQKFTKALIQKHLPLQSVREAIKSKIIKKYAPELKDQFPDKDSNERKGLITGAKIVMLILIAILIILNGPAIITHQNLSDEQSGADNFFVQLKQNYTDYIDAKNELVLFEGDKGSIKKFLNSSGLNSEPIFIDLANWEVKACFVTEFDGNKLANIVYTNTENSTLFNYQANLSLLDSKTLKLSSNLLDYLDAENCFSKRVNDQIYLLHRSKNKIFGFASDIKNKKFIAEICE